MRQNLEHFLNFFNSKKKEIHRQQGRKK